VKSEDPADEQDDVTAAVAAWVTDTVREALDGDDEAALSAMKVATRDRRHMLHAAGFLSALPWELEW
jgi:MoxR-like ATPase